MARLAFTFKKGENILGERRRLFIAHLKERYEKGASIRQLADEYGRSYGAVHRMLTESGVTLRGKGGPRVRVIKRLPNGKFAGGR